MSKEISKLNKLHKPESFLQVNTIRGFKYVDKAGEIVNHYHNDNIAPQFTMNLNGIVIEKPKDKIEQLKITPNVIWARYTAVDSLDMVQDLFVKEAQSLTNILEVVQVSRIGWRTHFVYEFLTKEKFESYFKKFSRCEGLKPLAQRFEIETNRDDVKATLNLEPVVKTDAVATLGVLFDIDLYQTGEIEVGNLSTVLRNWMTYLHDESGLLKVINATFE